MVVASCVLFVVSAVVCRLLLVACCVLFALSVDKIIIVVVGCLHAVVCHVLHVFRLFLFVMLVRCLLFDVWC